MRSIDGALRSAPRTGPTTPSITARRVAPFSLVRDHPVTNATSADAEIDAAEREDQRHAHRA